MSTYQDGDARGKTPRRTTRRTTATPVRDFSPPARSARAASTALHNTPATRRSARASKKPEQSKDSPNNELPEIQTRQSYAYGSSKTPVLPDQLHIRDQLTMKQLADQMDSAVNKAEQNLDTYAAELENGREDDEQQQPPQPQVKNHATNRRTSKDPSPPASVTTEAQKKQRTAAWASSLESGQLEDIPEEEQPQLDTPETRRTDPSSFPSGIFDQSYQYERGLRPPHAPPHARNTSLGVKIGSAFDQFVSSLRHLQQNCFAIIRATGLWLSRLFQQISSVIFEMPDSSVVSFITKTFFIIVLVGFMNYALCFGYTRFLCSPLSSSRVSQTLRAWCGNCQSTRSIINLAPGSEADVEKITSALKYISDEMRGMESRINSRLDSKVSAIHTDIDSLRKEQSDLGQQIQDVSDQALQTTSSDANSFFLGKVNYFSPANGAIVNVAFTSPTRQAPLSVPARLATRFLGLRRYRSKNPITALESWQDVGDCWCAAATIPDQDSVRLGVNIGYYMYPTELVIEHPPKAVTMTPETAPKLVELWADFSHLDPSQWPESSTNTVLPNNDVSINPFGHQFGLIASVEYKLASQSNYVQKFVLDVNQYGDLRHSARDFVVRVRSTHGADYGCLYRVRLHGEPVKHEDPL